MFTSMPMDWSVVFCAEEVFLAGGTRAEAVDGGAHLIRMHRRGVNVSRVPQVPVWTCGGYLGIRCAEGIALTHTPR